MDDTSLQTEDAPSLSEIAKNTQKDYEESFKLEIIQTFGPKKPEFGEIEYSESVGVGSQI